MVSLVVAVEVALAVALEVEVALEVALELALEWEERPKRRRGFERDSGNPGWLTDTEALRSRTRRRPHGKCSVVDSVVDGMVFGVSFLDLRIGEG